MENKLPKNWVETELLSISDVYTGKKDANFADDSGEYNFFTCAYMPLKSSSYSYEGEVLILPGNGVNVGEVFYFSGKFEAYQRTYIIDKIKISSKYLFYHFKRHWKELGTKKQYGSATNYIKMGNFKSYLVQIPPKSEQERIVAKLDHLFTELDTLNQKLNQIPNLLKNCRQAILNQAVTGKLTKEWRKGKELEEWEEKKIEEIAEFNPKYSIEDDKNVSFVPMANMGKGVFENLTLDTRKYSEVKKGYRRFKNDDVLLAKITPCFENQKSAVASQLTNNFGCGSSEYYVFKCSDVIFPIFLLFYFKTNSFIQQGTMNMTGSVGHKRVSQDFIKGYLINIPPKEEQTEIVHRVEQLFTELDHIEAKYKSLKQQTDNLPQAILHKAFKGELVPQLGTDGNAEDLLKEIQALKVKS